MEKVVAQSQERVQLGRCPKTIVSLSKLPRMEGPCKITNKAVKRQHGSEPKLLKAIALANCTRSLPLPGLADLERLQPPDAHRRRR